MVPSTVAHTKADIVSITERLQNFHFEYRRIIYIILGVFCLGKVYVIEDTHERNAAHCMSVTLRRMCSFFSVGKCIGFLFHYHIIFAVQVKGQHI